MHLFDCDSPLQFLKRQIDANQGVFRYKSRLAEAAGCQRSYLSQVLAKKALLSPEQAMGLADFWGLSSREADFFLMLVLHERAGTARLRGKLAQKLEGLRQEGSTLSGRLKEIELGKTPPAS